MACNGCVKKKLQLRSQPEPLSRAQVEELRTYIDHDVSVRERAGVVTFGRCLDVWVDDDQQGDRIEFGNIALETFHGVALIGFGMIESIERVGRP